MRKVFPLILCVALVACGGERVRSIPGPPSDGPEIIEKEVPVPVVCEVVVNAPARDIYGVDEDATLEEQNAALRGTIAQQAAYILDLAAGLIGCGGTVNDPHR